MDKSTTVKVKVYSRCTLTSTSIHIKIVRLASHSLPGELYTGNTYLHYTGHAHVEMT